MGSFLFGSHIQAILSVVFRSTYKIESEGKDQGVERQRAVFVEDVIQVLVAGFFLELGGFGAEERWGVGLWGGEVT